MTRFVLGAVVGFVVGAVVVAAACPEAVEVDSATLRARAARS